MFKIQQLDHIAITVSNLENSIQWYKEMLGGEVMEVPWEGSPVFISIGTSNVALFHYGGEMTENITSWDKIGIQHFAFCVDRENFLKAQGHFKQKGIEFRFSDHEICHSVYISDPDDHTVELTCYELE